MRKTNNPNQTARLGKSAKVWLMMFVVGITATSCASGHATNCAGWKPIRPTSQDANIMSDALVDQIVEHNEFGARVCGWKS